MRQKSTIIGLFMVVFVFSGGLPVFAQATLEDVLKRVAALEAEVKDIGAQNVALKGEIAGLKGQQAVQGQDITIVKEKASSTTSAQLPVGVNFMKSKLDVTMYGYVEVDAFLDDSSPGTKADLLYAAKEGDPSDGESEANIDIKETRIGFDIKAPVMDDGGKVSGKIETDFATANTNSPHTPRIRLAYADVSYDTWGVRAGQDWIFFAPLNTNRLTPGGSFKQGNMAGRVGQITLTNKWIVPGGKLKTQVGVVDSDLTTQETSGRPMEAAHLSYDTNILGVATTLNTGAVYGSYEPIAGSNQAIWGLTTGFVLAFTDWFSFKGEGYTGAGLCKFQATGNDTTVTANGTPLRGHGGFLELTYKPLQKVETNFGVGIDSLIDDSLNGAAGSSATALWDTNTVGYTNIKYSLTKDLMLGLEFIHAHTAWTDNTDGVDNRIATQVKYSF